MISPNLAAESTFTGSGASTSKCRRKMSLAAGILKTTTHRVPTFFFFFPSTNLLFFYFLFSTYFWCSRSRHLPITPRGIRYIFAWRCFPLLGLELKFFCVDVDQIIFVAGSIINYRIKVLVRNIFLENEGNNFKRNILQAI